jgi:hypothetical protein
MSSESATTLMEDALHAFLDGSQMAAEEQMITGELVCHLLCDIIFTKVGDSNNPPTSHEQCDITKVVKLTPKQEKNLSRTGHT